MGAVVSVRRREMTPRVSLLLLVAATAGLWTSFTVGAPVTVQVPEDPRRAECLVDTFGDNPGRLVSWHTDCGQALAVHMAASAGPTLVMLGALMAATAHGVQRRGRAAPAP
jgi:hypothetical protein